VSVWINIGESIAYAIDCIYKYCNMHHVLLIILTCIHVPPISSRLQYLIDGYPHTLHHISLYITTIYTYIHTYIDT
jgi:hypothetical protein